MCNFTLYRRRLFFGLLLLLQAFPDGFVSAADLKPRQIVAEFEVAPDGDFLRVPVGIAGKEYTFFINTGLATSTIEKSLVTKLELAKIPVEVRGKRGAEVRERFAGLRATLGNIPLEFAGGVETSDYSAITEKGDVVCQGEIAMDVLGRFVVQIDFDQGLLRLLTALPPSPGEAIRITPLGAEGGAPTIPVLFRGLPAEKFIVSTARAGNSLEIRSDLFGQLEDRKLLEVVSREKGLNRSGSVLYQTGTLEAVQVGKFRHEAIIANSAEQNAIGLSYLARYVVTFDFPRSRLYLKKGKDFDAPDSQLNLWDVGVNRDEGKVVIRDVAGSGPAPRLGLKAGDVVESINGVSVHRLTNWQVRRLFGRENRPLAAVILRGTERLTLAAKPRHADDDDK
jgi:hypothetical protein